MGICNELNIYISVILFISLQLVKHFLQSKLISEISSSDLGTLSVPPCNQTRLCKTSSAHFKASAVELWSFLVVVGSNRLLKCGTVELPEIWSAMMLMWRHRNGQHERPIFRPSSDKLFYVYTFKWENVCWLSFYFDNAVIEIKNNAWVTVNNDFGSRVRRFANHFHEWRSHELANRIRSDPEIVFLGNECIILFLKSYIMSRTHNSAKNNHRSLISQLSPRKVVSDLTTHLLSIERTDWPK